MGHNNHIFNKLKCHQEAINVQVVQKIVIITIEDAHNHHNHQIKRRKKIIKKNIQQKQKE